MGCDEWIDFLFFGMAMGKVTVVGGKRRKGGCLQVDEFALVVFHLRGELSNHNSFKILNFQKPTTVAIDESQEGEVSKASTFVAR